MGGGSRDQIQGEIDGLVTRAIVDGDTHRDSEAFDLLPALIGVTHVPLAPDWSQSAKPLVDIGLPRWK